MSEQCNLAEAVERLQKDLERGGGFGPQLVSAGEAIVEKADLRAVLDAIAKDRLPVDFGDHTDCPGCRICDKGYYG